MKKNFKYAILSAIALVGAVSFSACSSSDEIVNNPNYDSEKGAVKTEFVINVTQPSERTRQTSTVVGNESFQDIYDMYLFCFNGTPATTGTYSSMDANHTFSLDALGAPSPTWGATETTTSSKVYTLYIPTLTTNLLFYATANNSTKDAAPGTYGKLTKTYETAGSVGGITFSLVPRVSTAADVTTPQTTLAGILNAILAASITSPVSLTWAETTTDATYSTEPSLSALKNAYLNFTNQVVAGSYDVRQGSATAILNMVGQLFAAVNDVYSNEANATAHALAEKILQLIAVNFTVTETGTSPNIVYTWGNSFVTTDASVSGYPTSQGLPDGSAVLVVDGTTNQFGYINNGTMGANQAVSLAYNKITYPSELTYYCNSLLRQSTQSKEVSDYPVTASSWVTDGSWSGWSVGAVSAATRAVAMKENVTYGAAQLQSVIKLGTTSFTDNAATVTSDELENNVFDASDNAHTINFTVTGILIGGQPDQANFEYLPTSTSITNVIYDPITSSNTLAGNVTTGSVTNYTLVLDNFTTAETQSKVNIALEMTADKSFYGKSGYIKAGEKFYLIGQLDPDAATGVTAANWNNQPSFKDGSVEKTGYGEDRVFIRDAKTEATFTIGATALQNAYSTIPDLRSTQMLFGLSVDLVWKTGLTFNVGI